MLPEEVSGGAAGAGLVPRALGVARTLLRPEYGLSAVGLELGRWSLVLLPVYMAGYFNFSLVLVLGGLLGYVCWKQRRDGKDRSLRAALLRQDSEEQTALDGEGGAQAGGRQGLLRGLPAWISFSNVEKVEWLNKVLFQMWPVFAQYMEKLLKTDITAIVRGSHNHLQTFNFTKVDFGKRPMKIMGVEIQPTDQPHQQIIMDLHLSFNSDLEINCEIRKFFATFGLKGMQLHGTLRVILEPLVPELPLVGAITMFFIRRPSLDINWTGLTNLLDIPGLNVISDAMVLDIIAMTMVLPNRLTIPLVANIHVAELRCPLPRGIVRIHLVEASDLPKTDLGVKGIVSGKADPYAIVRVGPQVFTSKTIKSQINPKWNEMYEAIVHEVPGQELEVEMYDKDPDQDDYMGRMKLDLGEVKKCRFLDQWYSFESGKPGKVHLRLQWLVLMSNLSKLDEVLKENKDITARTRQEPASAFLAIYLQRAEKLPAKKAGKDPSPVVLFSVHDVTKESTKVQATCDPVWEQPINFLIQDPRSQDLDVQVKDDDREVTLGSVRIPLSRLLNSEDMTLDQAFQLENSGTESRIFMKLVMRILFQDASCRSQSPTRKSPVREKRGSSVGRSLEGEPLPTITSPNAHFGTESALRITLLEAENLIPKDRILKGFGKGSSDPYTVIRVGGKKFRSRVIDDNLNPRWNEVYEVIVDSIPGQEVSLEVFDKDIDKDDFLGRSKIDLTNLLKIRYMDEWVPLEDVKSGKVHIQIEVLTPSFTTDALEQVMLVNSLIQPKESEVLSSALLSVYVERAIGLPVRKGTKPPSPYVELSVKKQSYKTNVVTKTAAPIWDEMFAFLVKNPQTETLEMQVKDDSRVLGVISLSLSSLLRIKGLTLDRWVSLQQSDSDSKVLMRAQLKILCSTHLGPEVAALNLDSIIQSSKKDAENPDLRQRGYPTYSIPGPSNTPLGEIHLTIYFLPQEKKLVILVHACRNLRWQGKELPDPYVSMVLQPDKNRAKKKTSVKKKTLNPEYKEKFEWDLSLEDVRRKQVELSVKNNSTFMSRESDKIGKVYVDLSEIDPSQGLTQWFELIEDQDN